MKRFLTKCLQLETILLTATIFLVCYNAFFLFVYVMTQAGKKIAVVEPGSQYADFQEILHGVKEAGFLTNKDTSPEKNEGEFLQAQYFLAPTILDLNNADHQFVILDYTSPVYLNYVLKKINAVPIKDNEYQKILAQKRK